MKQYHKIQTVYLRDPNNSYKTLLEGVWAKPEFELLKDINWYCTEKIDGTNIRVIYNGENIQVRGKTDNAQIPTSLVQVLYNIFIPELLETVFPELDTSTVCFYGEGYGKKIQKGGNYLEDRVDFILFDIKIGDWWLTRESVEDVAEKLGINVVPIIGTWGLEQAVQYVKNGFISTIAQNKSYIAEGLVMKPEEELFNRKGERIITKIKYKDFKRS